MGLGNIFIFSLLFTSIASFGQQQQQQEIKGPPIKTEKSLTRIVEIGSNARLQCPIVGFPVPFFEWKKDGQLIDDYSWIRFKKNKNLLKIKNSNRDDSGIYECKGINGFGTDVARVNVVVVDSAKYPPHIDENNQEVLVSPPFFTSETKKAAKNIKLEVGEIFKISCEAIGFPAPYIRWFKDGEEIRDSVLPRRPRHYQRPRDVPPGSPGRSTVELQVLGTVDAGTYTCSAENPAARREVNFTLKVDPGSSSSSVQHAIVTEAGPANSTVVEGDAATLRCRVKSVSQPHIKWLKKLDEVDLANDEAGNLLDEIQRRKVVNIYTLNNGNEKYRVLDTRPDVKTANGEFLNELEIPEAEVTDSGMYICFVTNSGFGALTYKAAFLRVLPRALLHNNNINNSNNKGTSDRLLLALIVSLVGVTFIVGMVVIICVLRRSRKPPKEMPNSTSEVSRPIGPEEEDRMIQRRPFLMDNSTFKFEPASPSSLPPPPPLFPPPAAWSRTTVVYPARHYENPANVMVKQQQQQQQQQQPESPNQYEVPYSHLLQVNHHQQQLNSSGGNLHSKTNSSSSSNPLLQQHQQQQQHFGGHFPGRSSTFSPHNGNGNNSSSSFRKDKDRSSSPTPPPAAIIYPFRSHPYFQYLNDYET